MQKIIRYALSFPKTLYLNLKIFNFFTAIKLPIWVAYNTKIDRVYKGCIQFEGEIKKITFGIHRSSFLRDDKGYLNFSRDGKMIFRGRADFGTGCLINVGGEIIIGEDFSTNYGCILSCEKSIEIGKDVLLGWNVSIIDSDGHSITKDGLKVNHAQKILIGNHVWICSKSTILKGASIGTDCVVAYGSIVSKKLQDFQKVILGGSNSEILKQGYNWEK